MTFAQRLKQLAAGATGKGIAAPVGGALWHAEMESAEYELREFLANNALAIAAAIEAAELVNALSIQSGAHKALRAALDQLAKD